MTKARRLPSARLDPDIPDIVQPMSTRDEPGDERVPGEKVQTIEVVALFSNRGPPIEPEPRKEGGLALGANQF